MKKASTIGESSEAPQPKKARGRPRSFDREAALNAAMEVFWTKGYEAASINDLTAAMGINPPSLYAAFGDKEKLFLATIEQYAASRSDQMCPQQPTAKAAIESYLRFKADLLSGAGHPRGCMLMVAFFTAANASPGLNAVLSKKRAEAREHMRQRIKQGIAEGDVPEGTDAGALADFYATITNGMAQQARDGATRKSLMQTVDQAMSVFPAPPKGFKVPKRRDPVAA